MARFSKDTIQTAICERIADIEQYYGFNRDSGSSQLEGVTCQKAIAAYWEMQGFLRVVDMIEYGDY